MTEKFYIAAYCRISVDDELNKENTSIENQKAIIDDYVKTNFPNAELDFYEDRDKSGYTFEQREGYQKMRRKLFRNQYDILIIKDLSRFSRRNGAGLVELEALRDEGIRIIAIGDNIDYPTNDDWLRIQIYFLMNEMPVTDTSKKVRNVIKRRQQDGKWICSVPYGYVITNSKTMAFEIEPTEAVVVRKVYELYNQGWGYKRIANYLTDQHIPTPRMNERARKEARGEECHLKAKPQWSIATIQGILTNDFYIGTLRQGKYTRKKINGKDIKRDESDHIIFLKNHEPIIDYRVYATAQNAMQERTRNNYRGTRIYTNAYSGLMVCGDCGSPMFPMSRNDLKEAYRCGEYHKRGLKGCTSHHIRVDTLDAIVKAYLQMVRDTSSEMIDDLQETIAEEEKQIQTTNNTLEQLEEMIDDTKAEKKALLRQCARDIARKPEREKDIQETYDELIMECDERIEGLENQIKLTYDKHNTVVSANRTAQLAIDLFDEILNKEKLEKNDLELLIEKITVYEDHIHIKLKDDIDHILHLGSANLEKEQNQQSKNTKDKKFAVRVISDGDPLEIFTATDGEVVFKKYSPVGELGNFATQYADVLMRVSQMPTVITDRDHVIAVSGASKREYLERRVTQSLERYMEQRRCYIATETSNGDTFPVEGIDSPAGIIYPIIASGDVTGSVCMLESDTVKIPTNTEVKLCQSAAAFLGKQMEE
ncbi:stage V sporulation T C-terminal domain-containing protein [Ruminococcus sp.]|uniref:stage V sporulation T C-terminal domain-containing protein n=1 Tax=Ruminococcus sp. TaxID=41978 RepID=UPI002E8102D1|nr:stage V sporulation T C-terminal domain-containing protein [Ruminococcus sp.]MEE3439228.1 stage V sporulation T C-terminal domain-containing protein [Ruminococcus sp.]